MNIAYVCVSDARDPHSWSGIPYHILKAMQKQGHTVHVISPLKRSLRYLYLFHKLLGNRRLQIDREPLVLSSYANQVMKSLRRLKADIVFAPSSIPVSYLKCEQPIIWWTDAVYEGMLDYYAGYAAPNLDRAHQQERCAMETATRVFYASEWAADIARARYSEVADKISVIPFGANLPDGWVAARPVRTLEPPYKLLFLGVDWKRKGGSIAFDTVRLLNERGIPSILRIVGCEPPSNQVLPYVERYGYISKRTPAGAREIEQLLRSSHFLLLPTRAEAAGIVFSEASAHGLPIVTTSTGGVDTYVRNGINGITLPLEAGPDKYATAIGNIVNSPNVYAQLSHGAHNEYETRLNWDIAVQHLLSLTAVAH